MLEENVKVVKADGSECFVCEKKMDTGPPAIEVSFKVPIIGTLTKHMHVNPCAQELRKLLGRRIEESESF